MIFDTDVMIWAFRGNGKALDAIDEATTRSISSVTYMELLQGVRNKTEMLSMKRFLSTLGFAHNGGNLNPRNFHNGVLGAQKRPRRMRRAHLRHCP